MAELERVMITLFSCPHARQVFNVMVSGIFNRIGILHRLTTMGTVCLHVEVFPRLRWSLISCVSCLGFHHLLEIYLYVF